MNFKVGDVVRLISGSMLMTVIEITEPLSAPASVKCLWCIHGEFRDAEFENPNETLVKESARIHSQTQTQGA